MQILDKAGVNTALRYKLRKNAEAKLVNSNLSTGLQSVGFVIANSDGTFTPCVWLLGEDLRMAHHFASQGVQVIGGAA